MKKIQRTSPLLNFALEGCGVFIWQVGSKDESWILENWVAYLNPIGYFLVDVRRAHEKLVLRIYYWEQHLIF